MSQMDRIDLLLRVDARGSADPTSWTISGEPLSADELELAEQCEPQDFAAAAAMLETNAQRSTEVETAMTRLAGRLAAHPPDTTVEDLYRQALAGPMPAFHELATVLADAAGRPRPSALAAAQEQLRGCLEDWFGHLDILKVDTDCLSTERQRHLAELTLYIAIVRGDFDGPTADQERS